MDSEQKHAMTHNHEQSILPAIIVTFLIAFTLGLLSGLWAFECNFQQQAVTAGHAEYTRDLSGERAWRWKQQ